MLSPPICKGFVEVKIVPVFATLDTCVPFTYKRSAAPSYVSAKCVHVPTPNAPVPYVSAPAPPKVAPPPGSLLLSDVPSKK